MNKFRKLYFFKLFALNKGLFFLVVLFFVLNIIANTILPTEITPIYNWNLYSTPIQSQKKYQFLQVAYDDKILKIPQTWKDPQRVFIYNTINLFVSDKIDGREDYSKVHFTEKWLPNHQTFGKLFPSFHNYPTDADFTRFPFWYKKYLENCTNTKIENIDFYRKTLEFDESGKVKEIFSELIYSIK